MVQAICLGICLVFRLDFERSFGIYFLKVLNVHMPSERYKRFCMT